MLRLEEWLPSRNLEPARGICKIDRFDFIDRRIMETIKNNFLVLDQEHSSYLEAIKGTN